jgi:hypothetical protein
MIFIPSDGEGVRSLDRSSTFTGSISADMGEKWLLTEHRSNKPLGKRREMA